MTRSRRHKLARVVAACGLAAAFIVPVTSPQAAGAQSSAPATVPYSATKTLVRSYLNSDGSETIQTTNSVNVSVDQTANLYGREDINVSWSGAHPTGGIEPDPNSTAGPDQEYPVAILQCRGTPAQVTPETCWTHGTDARFQGVSFTSFAAWRLDRYESPDNRAAVVDRPPASAIPGCPAPSANERWVPFVALSGTSYPYGNGSCGPIPPEDYSFDSSQQAVPQNSTFAPTALDGTGSYKFDVWTDAENASLGCNATVACTLEVIPIVGISCDPYGVSTDSAPLPAEDIPPSTEVARDAGFCEAGGNYNPGDPINGSQGANIPVSGVLWWSASNWRNRFAVPLSFAPVSQACNVVAGGAPVDVYGSELMTEAAGQWAPYFCSNPSLFKLGQVATSEPLAERLIQDPTSGVHAAYSSISPPGGFSSPTVQAPVAVTGFSISYTIDDTKGNAVSTLRLNARLLAKLLTESYPGEEFDRFGDNPYVTKTFTDQNGNPTTAPYLEHNPFNITDDPEFQALNPGISAPFSTAGAATLIEVSEETDVTTALTSYIWSDPEARAWLNGQADPWGMVVNPYYATQLKQFFETAPLTLPVDRWPLLDTTTPDFGGTVPCNQDPTNATPWLSLVASPTPNLATTALDVQFAASSAKIKCASLSGIPGASDVQWSSLGRAIPGQRFVIGITSLGEAQRYDLNSAALQSQSIITNFTSKFTTDAGRTFVNPTDAAIDAAARLFTLDQPTHTWTVPYDTLRTSAAGKEAYPGTMIVNADIPTSGLPSSVAGDYSKLLTFAASQGQNPGAANGELPAGYVPMTAANGLGAEAAYTQLAATAVKEQKGVVPDVSQPSSSSSIAPSAPTQPSTTAPTSAAASPTNTATTPSVTQTVSPSLAAAQGKTPLFGVGLAGLLLPLVLGLGLLAALVSGGTAFRPRPAADGKRRSVLSMLPKDLPRRIPRPRFRRK